MVNQLIIDELGKCYSSKSYKSLFYISKHFWNKMVRCYIYKHPHVSMRVANLIYINLEISYEYRTLPIPQT